MAEALGVIEVDEEIENKNFVAEAQQEREAEPEPEAREYEELPHFAQSENHFQGQVITNESGKVINYRYPGGLMSDVAQGAVLEKILGVYQQVLEKGYVEKRYPDPDNASVTTVQRIERGDGHNMIDIWITKEQAVKSSTGIEKKSATPSPAELEAAAVQKFLILAATLTETFTGGADYAQRAEKVTSIEAERTVRTASMSGIELKGLRVAPAAAPETLVRGESTPVAATSSPVHTVGTEEVLKFTGQREDSAAVPETEASAPMEELRALQFLRAA